MNTRAQIRDLAARIAKSGSVAELECYEVGHVDEALKLFDEKAIAAPLHFQYVMGVPGGIAAREEHVRYLASLVPQNMKGASWGVAAVGRFQKPLTEAAMRLGGHARVGLEDNIYFEKGVLAEGSAPPAVKRAADYAKSIGRTPVDPNRARAMLGVAK